MCFVSLWLRNLKMSGRLDGWFIRGLALKVDHSPSRNLHGSVSYNVISLLSSLENMSSQVEEITCSVECLVRKYYCCGLKMEILEKGL